MTHNPPYRGWNWTSALEAGIRLIQFTWIDALLGAHAASSGPNALPVMRGDGCPRSGNTSSPHTSGSRGDTSRLAPRRTII